MVNAPKEEATMVVLSASVSKWLKLVDQVHGRVKSPKRAGRPYCYSDSVLIRCYLLTLVLPPLRQHADLHRFLSAHRLVRWLVGLPVLPHRTTFSRRMKALEAPLKARIWALGLAFIFSGQVQLHILLADGTLHQADGPSWPAKYKKEGMLPKKLRHVDTQAGWGFSPYHGWVWGYRTHPVVALTSDLEPIPVLAEVVAADVQDNTILARQLPWLPPEATVLLLDSSYEDQALVEAWTCTDDEGLLTRWLVIDPKKRRGQPSPWRQQLQVWRHVQEPDLYALRGQLIEPFFAHWKAAFQLDRLTFRGQDARVFLLLALYGYQLLIWLNRATGRPTFAYQHLLVGDPA
jgi:hypothetical protein